MVYSDAAMPTVDHTKPLIKAPEDIEKAGQLNPANGRIPVSIELAKLTAEKMPGPFTGGRFTSHFSLLCQAMGYPRAVRAIRRDQEFSRALFDWANDEVLFPYMKAYANAGVNKASGADAWAAFPHLTIEMIEEWVLPYADLLKQKCKKELGMTVNPGKGAGDYCEENPAKFNKELMHRCFDVSQETLSSKYVFTAMGRTQDWDMNWVQEYATQQKRGKKIPVMAELNARFVRDSEPEDIINKLREWIDIMGRDGALLISIGNIPANTPPVNIHTAVKATRVLGKYPIKKNLSVLDVLPAEYQSFDKWLKGQPEEAVILKAREWVPESKKVSA
jgi:hypothetical protein